MTAIKFNISEIEILAGKLSKLDAAAVGAGLIGAVNDVTVRAYATAKKDMLRSINLSELYIESKMAVNLATDPANIRSSIIGTGPSRGNYAGATMGRYDPVQKTKNVNWSNERIAAAGHKFGKWPKWTPRNGNKAAGIPYGSKAAGVQVTVKTGSASMFEHAFIMQLNNGNGIGLFTRSKGAKGKGAIKHRYGPAVYQLFRVAIPNIIDEIGGDLEKTITDEADRLMERAFA